MQGGNAGVAAKVPPPLAWACMRQWRALLISMARLHLRGGGEA